METIGRASSVFSLGAAGQRKTNSNPAGRPQEAWHRPKLNSYVLRAPSYHPVAFIARIDRVGFHGNIGSTGACPSMTCFCKCTDACNMCMYVAYMYECRHACMCIYHATTQSMFRAVRGPIPRSNSPFKPYPTHTWIPRHFPVTKLVST